MEIEKDIINYYNDQMSKKRDYFIKATEKVLGLNSLEQVVSGYNLLFPVFFVNENDLSTYIYSGDANQKETECAHYVIDKFDKKDNYLLGATCSVSSRIERAIKELDNNDFNQVIVSSPNVKIPYLYYKQFMFRQAYSYDLDYVFYALYKMGLEKNNITLKNVSRVYLLMLGYLSKMVLFDLKKSNVYLFDSETNSFSFTDDIPQYFKEFYNSFADIILDFVTSFDDFLNVVGREYFYSFCDNVLSENFDEVFNDILKMKDNRLSNMVVTSVSIDLPLVQSAYEKVKDKEKGEGHTL